MTYTRGHVKREPISGEIAVRTVFPLGTTPEEKNLEWLCAGWGTGPRNTSTDEVEWWDDLFTPDPSTAVTSIVIPPPSVLEPEVTLIPEFNSPPETPQEQTQ